MPTVEVKRDDLFESLGENFNTKPGVPSEEADDKFNLLCFQFGIELDDVTSEKAMQEKETGEAAANASDDIIYKIDIPANRYDLLCLEGISRSLRIFLGKEKAPIFRSVAPANGVHHQVIVKPETAKIRPIVVAAILRDFTFDAKNYKSFIKLQEKLHQNICRQRSIVSIGTHDLDTVEGPFTYEALAPTDIQFAPLNKTEVMDGPGVFSWIEKEKVELSKYLDLIRKSPVWPVIYDTKRRVLSLPPIINSNHSKITLDTKNVLIEITATDLTKAEIVLNMMISMFAEYCKDGHTVEQVEIVYPDGKKSLTPNLSVREVDVDVEYIKKSVGIPEVAADQVATLLDKMSLTSQLSNDQKSVKVTVPITRSDILHPCDIMEDVAIAYGYNNIKVTLPSVNTEGAQVPLNKLTDQLRREVAFSGFTEVLTFSLCSRDETFKFLNRVDDGSAVGIANPATAEFQVGRTSLLVGILKIIHNNRQQALPLNLFEISDILLKSEESDVGAKNQRNLCAVHVAQTSRFDVLHGLLDSVMNNMGATWKKDSDASHKKTYRLAPSEDTSFFPGQRADVLYEGKKIGVVGVLHPNVLSAYRIAYPVSALEINLEAFL
ncbi:phenylalanyl-tRNA synthetase beta chain-like [Planoprotostelium fungivorum]|uniref:phenylalanine--tRNA ligase n=1 Tax=Planoprotostelium fungivorum TaxID=1890364 RepID=A0A2P6MTM9_9EUKA|nr:phenylalanyl-tRNA synthetase beta chain-like [Planoprotostelium fungivorum]